MSKFVQVLRAVDFEVKTGETDYVVDLEPGDVQVDFLIYGDKPFQLYISTGDKVIPLGAGFVMKSRLRVQAAKWILIKTLKTAILAVQVFQQKISISEKLDMTPIMVNMAPAPTVDMRAMVDRLVAQKLEENYGKGRQEIDLDELVDDMPDDIDQEFGTGFMDMDEEHTERIVERVRARHATKAKVEPKGEDVKSDAKKSDTPEDIPKDKPEAAE